MRVRVKLGLVKNNDTEYKVGETLHVSDEEAKALLREGVVEEVKEEAPAEKPKKEAKPKKKPEAKKEEEPKEADQGEPEPAKVEPSLDWTRKELEEHATSLGIEEPEKFASKRAILKAIEEGEVKPE